MDKNATILSISNTSMYVRNIQGGLCKLDAGFPLISYAFVLVVLAIISTFENLVVIVALCKYAVLRSSSIVLLGVLAVVDLVTGLFVTPIKVWITVHPDSDAYDNVIWMFFWLFSGVIFFSLSTVLMISLDRFFQVCFLEKYKLTTNRLIFGLMVCWSMPFAIVVWIIIRRNADGLLIFMITYFFFCVLVMIVSYVGMVICLQRHMSAASDGDTRMNTLKNHQQAVRTTMIIIVVCIGMNLPPVVSFGLGIGGIYSNSLCAITFFVLLANSAVNPVIYCYRIPIMKKHVLKLLCNKRLEDDNDGSVDAFLTVLPENGETGTT